MNELPSPSAPNLQTDNTPRQAEPAAPSAHPRNAKTSLLRRFMYIVPLVLLLLLAAQWWNSRTAIKNLRKETAQRLQAGDALNNETRILAKSLQDAMKEMQAKVNVLEGKQIEAQSQQLALEQLYQDLSKNRDDWALAEIEQVLSTASQQLQLAGNVQGALIALQNADARLTRADKPQFIIIRRAIAKDMDKLKALPTVDSTGLALRLDSIIGQIDSLPLLADERPAVPATQPKNARYTETVPAGNMDWLSNLKNKWQSWSNEMWVEVRQLVQIRTVDTPDALLLSPTEAYYARENLKLRLLNARLALLSRNEPAFRSDLIAAQDTIGKYFDTRAKQTQTVQALLKQVQGSSVSIEMPTLAESLGAVRNYKVKP